MEATFTAVFQKIDDWYIGYVEELPGANTQGETLEEARENLSEAIRLILISNRELVKKEFSGRDIICERILVKWGRGSPSPRVKPALTPLRVLQRPAVALTSPKAKGAIKVTAKKVARLKEGEKQKSGKRRK